MPARSRGQRPRPTSAGSPQQALANFGKRLPTHAKWQQAVAGTPEATACNVARAETAEQRFAGCGDSGYTAGAIERDRCRRRTSNWFAEPDESRRFVEGFFAEFDDPRLEVDELIQAGDKVLVSLTGRGSGKQSGAEISWEVWNVWTLRNGRIVRGQGFTSPSPAFVAAGLRE